MMANDLDLISTSATAELLDQLHAALPGLNVDKCTTDLIAALVWLDSANGDRRDDDYILLQRDAGEVLMYEADIADSNVGKAWGRACVFGIAHDTTEFLRLAEQPFMVEFPLRNDIPANLRGRKIAVAIMGADEASSDPLVDYAAVSVRRDGTFVGDPNTLCRVA